jgi:tRNA threonylcarbamoyladenosine biosynthesis protein TsaE
MNQISGICSDQGPQNDIEIVLEDESQTKALAKLLAEKFIGPGDAMVLSGELGSGKTLFAKACGAVFCPTETVQSPSYSLMHVYSIGANVDRFSRGAFFCHLDFYRMKDPDECYALGWFDYLESGEHFSLVEWGERFPDVYEGISKNHFWSLRFDRLADESLENHRRVFIQAPENRRQELISFLSQGFVM